MDSMQQLVKMPRVKLVSFIMCGLIEQRYVELKINKFYMRTMQERIDGRLKWRKPDPKKK
jgi:hypothetical protein